MPPPEDSTKNGFVTALHRQLYYLFSQFGDPRPQIWRDVRQIDQGEQFDQKIADAIDASSLLLVVLSPNWMESDYCQRELKAFADRWKSEGGLRERIIVVGKRHVPDDRRPSLLQLQTGYRFYTLDDPDGVQFEREFFVRGEPRDRQYYEQVEKLADFLRKRAGRVGSSDPAIGPEPPMPQSPPKGGRTIYLARPASDMNGAYDRLATELATSGFVVLPDQNIPVESAAALQAIDQALDRAEISIHLLGEKPGFAPDDLDPIVRLQLKRAAMRAETDGAGAGRSFQRIIWAPKTMTPVAADGQSVELRDPLHVLDKFDRFLPTDAVSGDTLTKFSELVTQRLSHVSTPSTVPEPAPSNARVYVYHQQDDIEYAFDVGKALHARDLKPTFPASQGSDEERVRLHRRYLQECDTVVVCWAAAPDVWVKGFSSELMDWKLLGRTREFARRGLVAGPPPGFPKKMLVELHSKDEIDIALDLTAREHPEPGDLDALVTAR